MIGPWPALRAAGLAVVLGLLMSASGAWAYFSSTGTATASGGGVGSLSAPVITGATAGPGTVSLSWSAITPPGPGTVTYYVTRNGSLAGGNCPTSASPSTQTSCTDKGLAAGNDDTTVTAVWQSWTAASASANVLLSSGAAAQVFLTSATTNLGSGTTRTLTATIEDANGNTVTSGPDSTDAITFAKTAGTGTITGLSTITASGGVAADTITGALAGPISLQASATLSGPGATSSLAQSFSVVAGPATQLALSGSSTNLGAGATRTLTATIQDANGNTVTSGADSTD
ncbi:MAG: hypothetical protein ABI323_02580, partial [Solirubrobacteraceae bacterium]